MEKISEKVGLYDLWTVFFPGAVSMLIIGLDYHLLILQTPVCILFNNCDIPTNVFYWIIMMLISVFLGIILQEIAHYIGKIVLSKKASNGLLEAKYGVFIDGEITAFSKAYEKLGFREEKSVIESRRLFHTLNIYAQQKGIASRYIKLNLIQNMSLSLAAVMLFESLILVTGIIYHVFIHKVQQIMTIVILCIVSMVMIVAFLRRAKRFDRYWVRNIVYAVCANINESVDKSGTDKTDDEQLGKEND